MVTIVPGSRPPASATKSLTCIILRRSGRQLRGNVQGPAVGHTQGSQQAAVQALPQKLPLRPRVVDGTAINHRGAGERPIR